MVARADILAGRAVILVNIQDTIDKQLRGIRSKMRMFTSGISEMGGDLFRGGLASTIAAAFPVKEFVTFQDQMLFLQTKVQATDAQMKPLEKTIRQLGMTTSFSSQEVGKAATMYAQAGFSIVEIQNSLQAALDLSRGSQVDLTTSTTILSNALRTFQKDTSNAAMFASKFVTAARLGTLDIVDLGESLKYSAGTFANFGLELDDVLGMITTLANSGLKASLAGTSLNTAFLNLASSAPKLKELLDVDLFEEDFKNPIQALRKLEVGLSKFSKIEQAGILQELVNIRGGRAIQGLLLQGLDKLEANIDEIKRSADESRTSAIKLDSALGGVGRRALSAFQELNIAIGQTTEGPLSKFGERITAIFKDLSRLTVANQKLTQTLLLTAPAALAAGVSLLVMTSIVGKLAMLITPLMMLNSAIFSIGAAIVGVNIKQLSTVINLARMGGVGLRTGLAGSFLHTQLNLAEQLAPALQRVRGVLVAIAQLLQRMPTFPIHPPGPRVTNAGSNRGFRGSYGFPGMAGPALGFDSRVFAPTAAQNIPDAPAAAAVTKALNRTAGLILRPFQDLPEAQTKQTARGFDRIGRSFVATFQTRLNAPVRGFLQNFGKGLSTQVFRGFQIVSQSPKLLSDNRRGLIQTGVSGGLTTTAAQNLSEAVRTWTRTQSRIATTLPRLLTDQRRPTVTPRITSSQRLLGGPGAMGAGGQIIEGRVRSGGAIGAARQTGRGVSQELSRAGKAGAALRKAILGTVNAIRTGFGATAVGAIRVAIAAFGGFRTVLTAVGQAIRGVANFVVGTNWLRAFITGARGVWTVFKGMLTVLNGVRRVLFSLSGWLLIVEGLILFGDKIPIVKDALAGLGNAFNALFKGIGETFKNLGPSFGLLMKGFNDMFGGNIERGIDRIKGALSDMASIISTGLTAAWAKASSHIQTGVEILKESFTVLAATFQLLIDGIGTVFGAVFEAGEIIIKGDGSFMETLKSIFSPENRDAAYAMIGGFIAEIFRQLLNAIHAISKVFLEIKSVFMQVAGALQVGVSYLLEIFASMPHRISGLSDKQQQSMFLAAMGLRNEGQASMSAAAAAARASGVELDSAFNKRMDTLNKALNDFLAKLGRDETEPDSLPGKEAAAAEAAATGRNRAMIANVIDNALPAIASVWQTMGAIPLVDIGEENFSTAQQIEDSLKGTKQGRRVLDMIKQEIDTDDPMSWLRDTGLLMNEDEFLDSIKGKSQTERMAAEMRRNMALDMFNQFNTAQAKAGDGTLWAGFDEDASNEKLKEQVKSLLKTSPEEFKEGAKGLWEGFKTAFGMPDLADAVAPQAAQLAPIAASIGKAIVGDFESTRGNMMQMVPRMEKLQEQANQHLEDIDGGLAALNDRKNPFVFTA